jgi:hypothetical protein
MGVFNLQRTTGREQRDDSRTEEIGLSRRFVWVADGMAPADDGFKGKVALLLARGDH